MNDRRLDNNAPQFELNGRAAGAEGTRARAGARGDSSRARPMWTVPSSIRGTTSRRCATPDSWGMDPSPGATAARGGASSTRHWSSTRWRRRAASPAGSWSRRTWGRSRALMHYGTGAQKRLGAELVLSGDKPAICITEPGAGSAASEMATRADRRGGGYIVNGAKHWINRRRRLAPASGVRAGVRRAGRRARDRRFHRGARRDEGDLEIGAREPAMGLRGIPETEIRFEGHGDPGRSRSSCPPSGFRRGFAELMNAYNSQRVGAATVALGIADGAYRHALAYVGEREQFGTPAGRVPGPAMDARGHEHPDRRGPADDPQGGGRRRPLPGRDPGRPGPRSSPRRWRSR